MAITPPNKEGNMMQKENRHYRVSDLVEWRKRLGLSQREVADLMGTTQATVCTIEKGKNKNPVTIALYIVTLEHATGPEPEQERDDVLRLIWAAGLGAAAGAVLVSAVTLAVV